MVNSKKADPDANELQHANSNTSSSDTFLPLKGPKIISRGAFSERSLLPPPTIWKGKEGFLTPQGSRAPLVRDTPRESRDAGVPIQAGWPAVPATPAAPGPAGPALDLQGAPPALLPSLVAHSTIPGHPSQPNLPGAADLRGVPSAPSGSLTVPSTTPAPPCQPLLPGGQPDWSAFQRPQPQWGLPGRPLTGPGMPTSAQPSLGQGKAGIQEEPGGGEARGVENRDLGKQWQSAALLPAALPMLPSLQPPSALQITDGGRRSKEAQNRAGTAKGSAPKKPVAVKKLSRQGPSNKLLASTLASEQKRRVAAKGLSTRSKDTCSNLTQEGDRTVFRLLDGIARVAQQSSQAPQQIVPAISHLVDDMNDLRVGKPFKRRAAADFRWAVEHMVPNRTWTGIHEVPSAKATCQVFIDGKEAESFQRVAMRGDKWFSFDQIGRLSRQEFNGLYTEYMAATKALLPPLGDGSDAEREKFEGAHDSITRYLKESAILRMAHVLSNPTSMQMFAEQKAASVPPEVLQRIADAGQFTEEQIEKIWGCWYETVAVMVQLKPAEAQLHPQVQLAVKQCLECPHRLENYCTLLSTASELKRNLEAQAKMIFRMNAWSIMAMLDPIQVARMHVASGHHPLRLHLLFLSGIFPKPRRAASPPLPSS